MEVFKNEGNVSQDANFRAHLDDNWDSGNREFDKVEGQLEIALDDIQFLKNEIPDWKKKLENLKQQHSSDIDALNKVIEAQDKRIAKLENLKQQHSSDIDALNKVIEAQDKRIAKLEKAVFEAQYINDTDDKPDVDHSTKVSEINDDIVPDLSTNDSSAVVIESDNNAIIPDKIN